MIIPFLSVILLFQLIPYLLIFIVFSIFFGASISFAFNKINLNLRAIAFKRFVAFLVLILLALVIWEYPSLAFSMNPTCIIGRSTCPTLFGDCPDFYSTSERICWKTILDITSHPKYCGLPYGEEAKNCIVERSMNTNNAKGCFQLNEKSERDGCLQKITEQDPSPENCDIYPEKNNCYLDLAITLNDFSYCEEISHQVIREHCFFQVKINKKSLISENCNSECIENLVGDIYRERIVWCQKFTGQKPIQCVLSILDSLDDLPNYELIRKGLKNGTFCGGLKEPSPRPELGDFTQECKNEWI